MASQLYPPGTSDSPEVVKTWSNDSYARDGDNDNYTTNQLIGGEFGNYTNTDTLRLTNFNSGSFIPVGATVNGIEVAIHRKASRANNDESHVHDYRVQLRKTSGLVGDNKADTVSVWPTSEAIASYGGATDLWGTTWLDTDVNSANFGVDIIALLVAAAEDFVTASIDYVTITVHYTAGAAPATRILTGVAMQPHSHY